VGHEDRFSGRDVGDAKLEEQDERARTDLELLLLETNPVEASNKRARSSREQAARKSGTPRNECGSMVESSHARPALQGVLEGCWG
jgi:hypothetical protein